MASPTAEMARTKTQNIAVCKCDVSVIMEIAEEDVKICPNGMLKCKRQNRSVCVPKEFMCDAESFCDKGEDEQDCKKSDCKKDAFYCKADKKFALLPHKLFNLDACRSGKCATASVSARTGCFA